MSSNPGSSTRVTSIAPTTTSHGRHPTTAVATPPGRFRAMCGRYVSATPPDQIAGTSEPRRPRRCSSPATTWPRPRTCTRCSPTAPAATSTPSTGGSCHSGPRTRDRLADDQRPRRDPGRQDRLVRLQERRCLIPADGFYEWRRTRRTEGLKQPYFIHRPDGEPFAFAGLWETWRGPEPGPGGPAVLHDHHDDAQLGDGQDPRPDAGDPAAEGLGHLARPRDEDLELLGRLLVPTAPQLIAMRPMSTEVNNVRNDGLPHRRGAADRGGELTCSSCS